MEPAAPVEMLDPLVKELTATFNVFDQDGDGRISRSDLGVVLRSLGDQMSDDELDEVLVKADGDGDGFIDLGEFISFHTAAHVRASGAGSVPQTGDETHALQAAFEVFDADRNGFISAEELQTSTRRWRSAGT